MNLYCEGYSPLVDIRICIDERSTHDSRPRSITVRSILSCREESIHYSTPRLSLVLDLYGGHETPKKVESEQRADARRAELWTRVLGTDKKLSQVTRREWDRFIELRSSGAIDARGQVVADASRRPVRKGTVKADLVFLRTAIHWAMRWQDRTGRYLMDADPTRVFRVPRTLNRGVRSPRSIATRRCWPPPGRRICR